MTISNQGGLITVDFLFAIVLGFSMSAILFAMTFTLTVVEVAQYVTFAAARAHTAGNSSVDAQKNAAKEKYASLISNSAFGPLFRGGWFEISKKDELDIRSGTNGETFRTDYKSSPENRPVFTGVRAQLTAQMLDMKLPMVGKTSDEEGGFKTKILTILIREPNEDECRNFIDKRAAAIRSLESSRFSNYKERYYAMEDNGC